MNEKMQLPEGWEWTELGNIGEVVTGTTPSKKDSDNYGDFLPFVKPPDLHEGFVSSAQDNLSKKGATKARIIQENSVLVSCIGIIGKTGLTRKSVAINQQINGIIFNKDVNPLFGLYYFQSSNARNWLRNKASATTVSIINKSKFSQTPFPLPPLDEQERIVAKIETLFSQLDSGVASLKRIQAALKRYRASVLKAAFEGKLVSQDPANEPAEALLRRMGKVPIEDENLPTLPEGWCWAVIEDVVQINPKDNNLRSLSDDLTVSFVPMAAVDAYLGVIFTPTIKSLGEVRKGFTQFINGDVIFAKITPCMENGKAAIARNLHNGKGFGSTEFHVFRHGEAVIPEWIFHFIRQEKFRSDAKAHFSGTAGQLRVPVSFLSSYLLPLPPLGEQYRIVSFIEQYLSVIAEVESVINSLVTYSTRLRQAILKKAFEGGFTKNV